MPLNKEFEELQRILAQRDLLTKPRRAAKSGFMEFLLAKRKNMKIKIYQEKGHHLPHIHIDYGKQQHAASFSIQTGSRLQGNLPKKYDKDINSWLKRNRDTVLDIWNALQVGGNHNEFITSLVGDV